MPGIAPHMIVAKLVSEKLNFQEKDIYKGSLLPDILKGKKTKTHYKVQKEYFEVPDTDYYKENYDIKNPMNLGYFIHLALDKYYLEDFIPNKIQNYQIFDDKDLYKDYDYLNEDLVNYFELEVEKIEKILEYTKEDIDEEKLKKNIRMLKNKEKGKTKYINLQDFIEFLKISSEKITKEIQNIES